MVAEHLPASDSLFGMKASLQQVTMLLRSGVIPGYFRDVRWAYVQRPGRGASKQGNRGSRDRPLGMSIFAMPESICGYFASIMMRLHLLHQLAGAN